MEENQVPAEQTSTTASKEEKPNNVEALKRKTRELLEEKKKFQEKYYVEKSEKEKLLEAEMEAQGRYQDKNKALEERLERTEKERKDEKKTYVQSSLKSAIRQKALELGATKVDAVLKLMEKSDLEMIQVDEKFNVDHEGALMAVERVQKEYPELFTKKSAPAKAIMPNGSGVQTEIKEDIANMSLDELKEFYKKQGAKK